MPNYSEVDICNMALAMIGAEFIRSMDENNKRARACYILYPLTRDYLLTRMDWPFARKLALLQPLADTRQVRVHNPYAEAQVPPGWTAYLLPNDCLAPRDLYPPGSSDKWDQYQNMIFAKQTPEVEPKLTYTAYTENTALFSMTFVNLLALGLAAKMAANIAQDKALASSLINQWLGEQQIAFADDANIGNDYRAHDEMPEMDTFVHPDVRTYEKLPPPGGVEFDNT